MKPIISFLIFSVIFTFGRSQSMYYDALRLSELSATQDGVPTLPGSQETYEILAKYSPGLDLESEGEDVKDSYDNNPFICNSCPIQINDPNFSSESLIGGSSLLGGGLALPQLADGLAKFLVKRTKQELNTAFFTRFSDAMQEHPEFEQLFPSTTSTLSAIGTEIYQIDAYLNVLRESFIQDFRVFPGNLGSHLKSMNKSLFKDDKINELLPLLLDATQMSINGGSPDDIIQTLADHSVGELDTQLQPLDGGLKTLALFSTALLSENDDKVWISRQELGKLYKDPIGLRIFLGLLYQQENGSIHYGGTDDIHFQAFLRDAATIEGKFQIIKGHIQSLVQIGESISTEVKEINREFENFKDDLKESKQPRYEVFYNYTNDLINYLEEGIKFKNKITGQSPVLLDTLSLKSIRLLNDIFYDAKQQKFSSVIIKSNNLLELLLANQDFSYKKDLLKYGAFMAAIAQTQNSDEVAEVIEMFALPAGSSIMKKHTKLNVALNAYVGFYGGNESLILQDGKSRDALLLSMHAPIGITVSTGLKGNCGSLSAMISIIDLGALTAFRFKDPDADLLPDFNLQNIIAPGGYAVYGFGDNIPLSIGVGAQLGPNLRSITDTGAPTLNERAWRLGGFIAVDIPLLNFVNVGK